MHQLHPDIYPPYFLHFVLIPKKDVHRHEGLWWLKSNINVYSLCHHECRNTGDFSLGLDPIRLPRLDSNWLLSSVRMRYFCKCENMFLRAAHYRPEPNVRFVYQQWLLRDPYFKWFISDVVYMLSRKDMYYIPLSSWQTKPPRLCIKACMKIKGF